MYLKCTAEAQKAMGLRKEQLAEVQAVTAPLGSWLVHRFAVGHTRFFLFMSEVSLLSFVLYQGRKPVNAQTLPALFTVGLGQLLALEGLDAKAIAQVMAQGHASQFAKTDSRKTLGSMNDLVRCYSTMVEVQGGLQTCDLTDIIHKINAMPQRPLKWGSAWEVTVDLLEAERVGRH